MQKLPIGIQFFDSLREGNFLYIIEFKMTSAQVALDQIRARGYDRPYRASGKPVVLIGIAFDKEKRAIGDWKSEPAAEQPTAAAE